MTIQLYKEAFVEDGDTWRWRFSSSDEGLFNIEYQEYDKETKQWFTKGPAQDLWTSAKDQIIEAIKTVCETAG
jgi:hypothetical protein